MGIGSYSHVNQIPGEFRMRRWLFAALTIVGVVSTQPAWAQASKPIVSVEEIDDIANSGQARALSTMIATAVSSTSKFRVMERMQMNKQLKEQGRAKGGLVTTSTPGRVGGFEGVDFQIYGSISALAVVQKSDIGAALLGGMLSNNASGSKCNSSEVTLSLDVKITDADTGEIRYVGQINERERGATLCDGGAGQVNAASILRKAADKIATRLVTTVYPMQLAALQADGTFILNYGEGAVNIKDTMTVFRKGENIIDPANGQVIGTNEEALGLIQITDVLPRMSKGIALAGFVSPAPVGSIVRLASDQDRAIFSKKKKR